ncbi:MAG: bifunctional diguanylate cyclase/phosphodiesterase [Rhodobacterales bacterium]|nr:bifunctional diguanylate cyclase/phosphodiesterase [Rhodobacterales bacterium]MDX5389308.1 bifunctional diguanylate cyclase/phosphodiesterase [Rhodobacterales bacterium]MDX5489005.1 bifunctional diguanylate cyclase/phosphodiesterase [Rhodobacterales bacterium]
MGQAFSKWNAWLRHIGRSLVTGPQALAFMPAMALAAFWIGGEAWLIIVALALPLIIALASRSAEGSVAPSERDPSPPEESMDALNRALEAAMSGATRTGRSTGCIMLAVDDLRDLLDRHGLGATETIMLRLAARITSSLREGDRVVRLPGGEFGIAIAPMRHLDLESAIQMAGRLQLSVEEPLSLDATTVYLSCSVGFCLASRNPGSGSSDLLDAARAALSDAQQNGPSAIRAFNERMRVSRARESLLADEAAAALEAGLIVPWFQPQISTDTGLITGFEALARWQHPERGLISPTEFLPVLEQSGQLERLGEVMLYHALTALRSWDAAGLDIPRVGVNFANEELHNPKLLDKIRWELDRFNLPASRLSVEVLETVVAAAPDDTVSRNINGLAKLGCVIDLDDFGTGHASISSIRRFAVARIKIDRSFVLKVDRDPEQQRIVNAILTMADRLDLDTLAEGVETLGEHAMLAQLGCGHVQGFGIARPMPFDQTADWIRNHNTKLQQAPTIGRSAG